MIWMTVTVVVSHTHSDADDSDESAHTMANDMSTDLVSHMDMSERGRHMILRDRIVSMARLVTDLTLEGDHEIFPCCCCCCGY